MLRLAKRLRNFTDFLKTFDNICLIDIQNCTEATNSCKAARGLQAAFLKSHRECTSTKISRRQ